jgi:hypothetical protein
MDILKIFKINTIKRTTMSESISRPWMKHLISGVIFLVLAALYCSPELSGKKINAHDSVSAVAAAKEVSDYAAKGETILWSNGMFSGMPMFQVAYAPKANLLLIFDYYQTLLPTGLMLLFTLMLGFYFLMAQLKINQLVSINWTYFSNSCSENLLINHT